MLQTLTYMYIMDLDSATCFMSSLHLDSIQLGVAMVPHPNLYCPARVGMSGGQDKEVLLGQVCKCGGLTPRLSDRGVGTMVTTSWICVKARELIHSTLKDNAFTSSHQWRYSRPPSTPRGVCVVL